MKLLPPLALLDLDTDEVLSSIHDLGDAKKPKAKTYIPMCDCEGAKAQDQLRKGKGDAVCMSTKIVRTEATKDDTCIHCGSYVYYKEAV